MKTAETWVDLRSKGYRVNPDEVAMMFDVTGASARKALQRMAKSRLARPLSHRWWILESETLDQMEAATYICAPYPCYLSGAGALARAGYIEQIPKIWHVTSLGRGESRAEKGSLWLSTSVRSCGAVNSWAFYRHLSTDVKIQPESKIKRWAKPSKGRL